MSALRGLAAFKHNLCTLASVSSPESVVKSMQVKARQSQAACHCILTVRFVPSVSARLLTAGKLILMRKEKKSIWIDWKIPQVVFFKRSQLISCLGFFFSSLKKFDIFWPRASPSGPESYYVVEVGWLSMQIFLLIWIPRQRLSDVKLNCCHLTNALAVKSFDKSLVRIRGFRI